MYNTNPSSLTLRMYPNTSSISTVFRPEQFDLILSQSRGIENFQQSLWYMKLNKDLKIPDKPPFLNTLEDMMIIVGKFGQAEFYEWLDSYPESGRPDGLYSSYSDASINFGGFITRDFLEALAIHYRYTVYNAAKRSIKYNLVHDALPEHINYEDFRLNARYFKNGLPVYLSDSLIEFKNYSPVALIEFFKNYTNPENSMFQNSAGQVIAPVRLENIIMQKQQKDAEERQNEKREFAYRKQLAVAVDVAKTQYANFIILSDIARQVRTETHELNSHSRNHKLAVEPIKYLFYMAKLDSAASSSLSVAPTSPAKRYRETFSGTASSSLPVALASPAKGYCETFGELCNSGHLIIKGYITLLDIVYNCLGKAEIITDFVKSYDNSLANNFFPSERLSREHLQIILEDELKIYHKAHDLAEPPAVPQIFSPMRSMALPFLQETLNTYKDYKVFRTVLTVSSAAGSSSSIASQVPVSISGSHPRMPIIARTATDSPVAPRTTGDGKSAYNDNSYGVPICRIDSAPKTWDDLLTSTSDLVGKNPKYLTFEDVLHYISYLSTHERSSIVINFIDTYPETLDIDKDNKNKFLSFENRFISRDTLKHIYSKLGELNFRKIYNELLKKPDKLA